MAVDRGSGAAGLLRVLPAAVLGAAAVAAVALAGLGPFLGFFLWVRLSYDLATLWLPIGLVVAGTASTVARRGRWRAAVALSLGLALVLGGLRVWASHVEPFRLEVREERLESPKVTRALRVVHLSDIQSGRVGEWERRVLDRVASLEPDLVLFTGDLLQPVPPATFATELPRIATMMSTLRPPLGFYGVTGNTDRELRGLGADQLGGLRLVDGSEAVVEAGGSRIRLLGLGLMDSFRPRRARELVAAWLDTVAPTDLSIVLGHVPDLALELGDLQVDLCLAGHTHGGQIRLPWVGPLVTLSAAPRSWARGMRRVGSTFVDVSAGVGAERAAGLPPIRLNCPPEVTLIIVEPPGVVENATPSSGGWRSW